MDRWCEEELLYLFSLLICLFRWKEEGGWGGEDWGGVGWCGEGSISTFVCWMFKLLGIEHHGVSFFQDFMGSL